MKYITKVSRREIEIIQLISLGLTDKEIAPKTNISHHTVKDHRKRIMRKLDCHNAASIVRRAFELGILKVQNSSAQFDIAV